MKKKYWTKTRISVGIMSIISILLVILTTKNINDFWFFGCLGLLFTFVIAH